MSPTVAAIRKAKEVELENAEKALQEFRLEMEESRRQAPGDEVTHAILRAEEIRKLQEIGNLKRELSQLEFRIPEEKTILAGSIDVGSKAKITVTYFDGDEETYEVRLVAVFGSRDETEATIESPVGKAIHGKFPGDTVQTQINGFPARIHIHAVS